MFTNCFITPSVIESRHVGLVKPIVHHSISVLDKVLYKIDHFRVTSHMTNCVFGRHVGGKTKKNKKSF